VRFSVSSSKCLTVVTCSLMLAAQMLAATTSTTTNTTATRMSHQAADIFKQVNLAETALDANQKTVALHHIDTAMANRTQLAAMAKADNLPMVVPIYSEFEDESVVGPVLASKNNGKNPPNMKGPIAVDEASDQLTFVGIDLDKTKTRLESARTAIDNNNMQAAKDTLKAIGDDLVVVKVDTDAPLLAARENLGIAQTAAKRHSYTEAKGALKEASIDLGEYAKENSAKHSQEATELKAKIDKLSNSVNGSQAGVEGTIEQWWDTVDSWMHHPSI
jgi:hypothetical protein